MSSLTSTVSVKGHYMVGSAESGHDFVQNMYGMYIRFAQNIVSDKSNLDISAEAFDYIYKPLIATSLGNMPSEDGTTLSSIQEGESNGTITDSQLLKITRDYRDVLVALWKNNSPHMRWKEFKNGPLGFSLITKFEEESSKFTYGVEISYEELVNSPHRVFTAIVHHLLPRQDNPDHPQFGLATREINEDCLDGVISKSGIRAYREGVSEELPFSVGIHKQFLTQEQIDEVNEFIENL